MIGALGELSPYMLWFCLNMRFKGRVLMVYKSEWLSWKSLYEPTQHGNGDPRRSTTICFNKIEAAKSSSPTLLPKEDVKLLTHHLFNC